MAYTDHCLGEMMDRLKASDKWNDLLVVILSDHSMKTDKKHKNSDYYVAQIPMVWTGGAVKEHRVVNKFVAQSDMAATLLGQLRISHDEFIFSRDVFSKTYTMPSAFHTFDNGMSLIDSTGVTTYDNDAQKVIRSEAFSSSAFNPSLHEEKAKAILQSVYKDAGAR
jgi:phosphoglycerol transferase MdoB-like AlkP superfamily enzyme